MGQINKIVFIDDDTICTYINVALIEEWGIAREVKSVSSSAKGLQFMQKHYGKHTNHQLQCPDLIFLDIKMPGMDGFEFLDELKRLKLNGNSQFNIVMLTATLSPQLIAEAQNRHDLVHSCLAKPLSKAQLSQLLQELYPNICIPAKALL